MRTSQFVYFFNVKLHLSLQGVFYILFEICVYAYLSDVFNPRIASHVTIILVSLFRNNPLCVRARMCNALADYIYA